MIGLYSVQEYQLPIADIGQLLAKRGLTAGTAFYRVEFNRGHGFDITIAVLVTEESAVITLIVPMPIQAIDFRIAEFTPSPVNALENRLDRRGVYFESVIITASGLLPSFLRCIEGLHVNEWSNYEGICNDGNRIHGDVLVLNKFMHSFSAYCAREPYTDFAWQFFRLGMLSFQEMRSLRLLALTFL
jgi:hypothetical protein